MSGKLVSEIHTKISSGRTDIKFDNFSLNSGIYILMIKTPTGTISQKVIIE